MFNVKMSQDFSHIMMLFMVLKMNRCRFNKTNIFLYQLTLHLMWYWFVFVASLFFPELFKTFNAAHFVFVHVKFLKIIIQTG